MNILDRIRRQRAGWEYGAPEFARTISVREAWHSGLWETHEVYALIGGDFHRVKCLIGTGVGGKYYTLMDDEDCDSAITYSRPFDPLYIVPKKSRLLYDMLDEERPNAE